MFFPSEFKRTSACRKRIKYNNDDEEDDNDDDDDNNNNNINVHLDMKISKLKFNSTDITRSVITFIQPTERSE